MRLRYAHSSFTNQGAIRQASDEVTSPRFWEMERRVAFWLQPRLDLRVTREVAEAPFIVDELETVERVRAKNPVLLLADLGLTSSSAVKYTWDIYLSFS